MKLAVTGNETLKTIQTAASAALTVIPRHEDPRTTHRHPAKRLRAVAVIRVAIESRTGKRSE